MTAVGICGCLKLRMLACFVHVVKVVESIVALEEVFRRRAASLRRHAVIEGLC